MLQDLIHEQAFLPSMPDNLKTGRVVSAFGSGFVENCVRPVYAVGGGLYLAVPMFLILPIEGQLVNLITTGIAILVCAVVVWSFQVFTPKDFLAITAAYALVWVVFVGTQKIGHFRLLPVEL